MTTYVLTKDGEEHFRGTGTQCFAQLLALQPHSTLHAIRHEGWRISPDRPDWWIDNRLGYLLCDPCHEVGGWRGFTPVRVGDDTFSDDRCDRCGVTVPPR